MILNSLVCFFLKIIFKNMALYFVRSPFSSSQSHFNLDFFFFCPFCPCSHFRIFVLETNTGLLLSVACNDQIVPASLGLIKFSPLAPTVLCMYKTTSPFSYISQWLPLRDMGVLWTTGGSFLILPEAILLSLLSIMPE